MDNANFLSLERLRLCDSLLSQPFYDQAEARIRLRLTPPISREAPGKKRKKKKARPRRRGFYFCPVGLGWIRRCQRHRHHRGGDGLKTRVLFTHTSEFSMRSPAVDKIGTRAGSTKGKGREEKTRNFESEYAGRMPQRAVFFVLFFSFLAVDLGHRK